MIKVVGLFKRKSGMTPEEFRDYYETVHAPLAVSVAPMGGDYRRNYPLLMRINGQEVDGDPTFDAISEMWFDDQAAYDAFSEAMKRPEVRDIMVADEARFMDRSQSMIFIVDERCLSEA